MKRIYLVKKDEHLPTSQDNWIEMNALQFAAFLETDAGQRRRNRFLQLNNTLEDDEVIFYECSEKEYPIWKKERESELYKNRRQFTPVPSVIKARIKKEYDVYQGIKLQITDEIDKIEEVIYSERDEHGAQYLKIRTTDNVTFKRFFKRKEK